MAQYIDKAALVARIRKLKMNIGNIFNEYDEGFWVGMATAFDDVICALDTLEVKESLTWQDIRLISEIGEDFMNSEESDNLSEEDYYQEILNRFRAQKGK